MSISSIGSNPGLAQLLQSLGSANQPGSTGNTSTLLATLNQDSGSEPDGAAGSNPLFGGHHGRHHGLSTQLESAITSALQGSSGTTDPNALIQQAIKNLLTSNAKSATAGLTGSNTTSSSDQTSNAADSQAVFSQLLQSNGVDADQFQQDLQSAIQTSQQSGEGINFPALFQNFPPGSVIDTTA